LLIDPPMLILVRHVTRYRYAEPASYTIQSLRLVPQSFQGQRVLDWRVLAGGAIPALQFMDGCGNIVHLLTIHARHQELVIEAVGTVETRDCNGVVQGLAKGAPPRVFLKETGQTRPDAAIRGLAQAVEGKDVLERLHALAGAVRERVAYVRGATDRHTTAAEALADGKGVCQDHAHIYIAAARTLGIPARYVTGYLVLDDAETAPAHHAWAEAWVEALGWVGFDVANGVCPTEAYVRLACGLDAGYAAPIVGSRRGGAAEKLEVAVTVEQQQTAQQ
jgi:transglutaminase-like putative cysteine protease